MTQINAQSNINIYCIRSASVFYMLGDRFKTAVEMFAIYSIIEL